MSLVLRWAQSWNGTLFSFTQTWGEGDGGALSVVAAASLGFGARELDTGELSVVATATFEPRSAPRNATTFNVPGSTTVLWEGTTLKVPAELSIAATGLLSGNSALGSAFEIVDAQTEMAPFAGSTPHAVVIAVSSAVPVFTGSNANDFTGFSIPATGSLAFSTSPAGTADFSIAATATLTPAGIHLERSDFHVLNAAPATPWATLAVNPRAVPWNAAATPVFDPYSRADGAFGISGAALVEFGQTAGTLGFAPFSIQTVSSVAFGASSRSDAVVGVQGLLFAEFGQPGGGVEFGGLELTHEANLEFGAFSFGQSTARWASTSRFTFSSINFVAEDDDLVKDSRPEVFWQAAAQQEAWERDKKRLAKIARTDEDDLLVLAAALSQAVSQATLTRGVEQ